MSSAITDIKAEESEEEAPTAVVIDNGTGVLKAGFAGNDAPTVTLPCSIGKLRDSPIISLGVSDNSTATIGPHMEKSLYSLCQPMEHGKIIDWETMEKLWCQLYYNELRVLPEEHPLLITQRASSPISDRRKMAEFFFEKLNIPKLFVGNQAVMALYASGRHAGVTLDIGDGVTDVVPIQGCYVTRNAIKRIELGGRDLTNYMYRMLLGQGVNLASNMEKEIVRDIKESLCHTALDYNEALSQSQSSSSWEKTYSLPDCTKITVNDHRFKVPECLFNPLSHLGMDVEGVHKMVYESIWSCDIYSRMDFCANVILVGGSSMFPGFKERLDQELSALIPSAARLKIVEPPERKYSVWIGGSIQASLSSCPWVSKKDYDEHGPLIVDKQCLCF